MGYLDVCIIPVIPLALSCNVKPWHIKSKPPIIVCILTVQVYWLNTNTNSLCNSLEWTFGYVTDMTVVVECDVTPHSIQFNV